MRLHLASGNPHKAGEFAALAAGARLAMEIVPGDGAGQMPSVTEDTGTFTGNARKKARALHALLPPGAWVLADDSGLCVDALNGAPGVESAYYAGPQGDGAANLRRLVEVMRDVPADCRTAHFTCVLVLIDARGGEHLFEGRCDGRLAKEPHGGAGFGYDPLFVPAGQSFTFAELPEARKSELSHRGRAWAQLAAWFHGQPGGLSPG